MQKAFWSGAECTLLILRHIPGFLKGAFADLPQGRNESSIYEGAHRTADWQIAS